jgi:hypothetical protein
MHTMSTAYATVPEWTKQANANHGHTASAKGQKGQKSARTPRRVAVKSSFNSACQRRDEASLRAGLILYGPSEVQQQGQHADRVVAQLNSQVAVDVGAPALTYAARLSSRESPMRHFANEGHGAVTEAAQGFKGDGTERAVGAVVVTEVLLHFSSFRLLAALPACCN